MLDKEVIIKNMKLAYQEAVKAKGWTLPNPLVGCVILDKDLNFISSGYHKKNGGPHAEIEALNLISNKDTTLKGAHIFVTLEPCSHEGRTGSCAKALAKYSISSLYYGSVDPNPQVAGRGVDLLKKAGVQVYDFSNLDLDNELSLEIQRMNDVFFYNMIHKKSFVVLKVATSLDSQMALKSGESQWITSQRSREMAQDLRAQYDAVLVGVGTYLKDNPSLNIRSKNYKGKNNKVIIIDPDYKSIESIEKSNIYKTHKNSDVIVVGKMSSKKIKSHGVTIMHVMTSDKIDFIDLKSQFYKMGITSIYVEGGAWVFSEFFKQKSFDKIYQFISPTIIGDKGGLNWTKDLEIERLDQKIKFEDVKWTPIGSEILLEARP